MLLPALLCSADGAHLSSKGIGSSKRSLQPVDLVCLVLHLQFQVNVPEAVPQANALVG